MGSKIHDDESIRELQRHLGGCIRAARKALGLTQAQAAARVHVSAEFYARIERGRALPSVETLAMMVDGLGVSADRLLGLDRARGRSQRQKDLPSDIAYIVKRAREHRKTYKLVLAILRYRD